MMEKSGETTQILEGAGAFESILITESAIAFNAASSTVFATC